jgi:hypothetical protein
MKAQRKAGKEKGQSSAGVTVGFEVNPYYEQLLELREKKPAAYKVMSTATRLALEAYLKAKDAAAGRAEIRKAAA